MPLILKTKQDRQIWQQMTPNQREFAKNGQCINLTADYLPEDIPIRFVFVCINEMLWEFISSQEDVDYDIKHPIKVHFEDGVFKATQPIKHEHYGYFSTWFNLPNIVKISKFYKSLPIKYQEFVLSKVGYKGY
jgi:hypothetical protein